MQKVNLKYKPLFTQHPRYFILMGGRAAGRSMVASQYALANLRAPGFFRCAIMRLVLGDIRNSIYQDICDRIDEEDLREEIDVREHDLTFKFGQNRINGIGFKKSSGDQKSKLKSLANYTCVIIEEADEIGEEDFVQLDDSLRTVNQDIVIILLLNPPSKNHWIVKKWFNLIYSGIEGFYLPELKESAKSNTVFIHTTYLDNIENIGESTKLNYENYKITKPEHYHNMIKGLVSEGKRGRIFKNWKPTTKEVFESLPFPVFYGLDFGFSNDPTALIAIKKHNNKVWFRQLIYETGLTNAALDKKMGQVGVDKEAKIYGDGEEAKSIYELSLLGWNIQAADKGPGSVNAGLDMMLSMEIFYTEDSTNLAKESEEYSWALDRDKNPTNTPEDKNNHGIDAGRYGIYSDSKQAYIGF